MKNKRNNIKTKISEIIDYWIQYEDECDLNFDWAEADQVCWRCGCIRPLQRCHIIPDSLGGKDTPSNFVLLCADCHEQAPNVENSQFMWDWIKSFKAPFYNTFWKLQANEEYEKIYHKSFIQELKERNIITYHAFDKFWNLQVGRTSYHFGHPYPNGSTLAGKYKMQLNAFDQKYPNALYATDSQIELEKVFEFLTGSICSLAKEFGFSVWEGGTKNPYSLFISAFFPSAFEHLGVSIRMNKKGEYFMYVGNGYNPNHLPLKAYQIALENDSKSILHRIKVEIQNLKALYGENDQSHTIFSVINPFGMQMDREL